MTAGYRPQDDYALQDAWAKQRQAESEARRLDAVQQAAYAEGRKDEREEWLPVLEAMKAIVYMCEMHGDFRNGVTDPTGTVDEGNVRASEVIRAGRLAIERVEGKA